MFSITAIIFGSTLPFRSGLPQDDDDGAAAAGVRAAALLPLDEFLVAIPRIIPHSGGGGSTAAPRAA